MLQRLERCVEGAAQKHPSLTRGSIFRCCFADLFLKCGPNRFSDVPIWDGTVSMVQCTAVEFS